MLLEQFGGANGELAAAMQYSIQGLNCEDPERKDLLMDIGTEELSHLEIVGALARLHLKPLKFDRQHAGADPLIAIAGGGGVNLFNSQGNPWTADYLKITGELDVDLRSNIAADASARPPCCSRSFAFSGTSQLLVAAELARASSCPADLLIPLTSLWDHVIAKGCRQSSRAVTSSLEIVHQCLTLCNHGVIERHRQVVTWAG